MFFYRIVGVLSTLRRKAYTSAAATMTSTPLYAAETVTVRSVIETSENMNGLRNEGAKSNYTEEVANADDKSEDKRDKFYRMVTVDKTPYTIVKEGKAEVLFPSSHDVFYNPVQEFNRDLSIAVLKHFVKTIPVMRKGRYKNLKACGESSLPKLRVLEALSASGLRSIRYAKEVPELTNIIANDMCSQAYESIERNVCYNNVKNIVTPHNEEASLLMYQHRKPHARFDVVDLDPYGTASPFLDAAVQCVADGGLLMVTCTDMSVLCGNTPEVCHAKYGATTVKASFCHEMALRIVLQSIESHANRYGRYIEPILSLSIDFYVRVFVQIFTAPIVVKRSLCKQGMMYNCQGCCAFHLQPLGNQIITDKGEKFVAASGPPVNSKCDICGHNHKIGGPLWIANLHNKEFIQKTVEIVESEVGNFRTAKRILGVLNVVLEELDDCPLFYRLDHLCHVVHVSTPSSLQIRSAILNAGYRVSLSHVMPTSIKTDAPPEVIWDIVRAWVKLNPGKKSYDNEPSKTILSKVPSIEVSFQPHPSANPKSRINNLLRFQMNPEPFWGPKCRATTSLWSHKDAEKREKFQSKKKKKCASEDEQDLKQYPCKKFKKNKCTMGDNCRYSHDVENKQDVDEIIS